MYKTLIISVFLFFLIVFLCRFTVIINYFFIIIYYIFVVLNIIQLKKYQTFAQLTAQLTAQLFNFHLFLFYSDTSFIKTKKKPIFWGFFYNLFCCIALKQ